MNLKNLIQRLLFKSATCNSPAFAIWKKACIIKKKIVRGNRYKLVVFCLLLYSVYVTITCKCGTTLSFSESCCFNDYAFIYAAQYRIGNGRIIFGIW